MLLQEVTYPQLMLSYKFQVLQEHPLYINTGHVSIRKIHSASNTIFKQPNNMNILEISIERVENL